MFKLTKLSNSAIIQLLTEVHKNQYKKKQNPKNKLILQFKIWIKQDKQLRL